MKWLDNKWENFFEARLQLDGNCLNLNWFFFIFFLGILMKKRFMANCFSFGKIDWAFDNEPLFIDSKTMGEFGFWFKGRQTLHALVKLFQHILSKKSPISQTRTSTTINKSLQWTHEKNPIHQLLSEIQSHVCPKKPLMNSHNLYLDKI